MKAWILSIPLTVLYWDEGLDVVNITYCFILRWRLGCCQYHLLFCTEMKAWMGLKNIIPTIMMGKMEIEFPAIHMIKKFIGICLRGPKAMSHDLCRKKTRIYILTQGNIHPSLLLFSLLKTGVNGLPTLEGKKITLYI